MFLTTALSAAAFPLPQALAASAVSKLPAVVKAKMLQMRPAAGSTPTVPFHYADIMVCSPYCEKVAEVFLDNPDVYEDGIRVAPPDPAPGTDAADWRVVKPLKRRTALDYAGDPNGGSKTAKDLANQSGKSGGAKGDAKSEVEIEAAKKGPSAWLLGFDLTGGYGRRTWSTDGNALTDVASPGYPWLEFGLRFRPPSILFLGDYTPVPELELTRLWDFAEAASSQDPGRSSHFGKFDVDLRIRVFHLYRPVSWMAIFGIRNQEFDTSPTTAHNFSWSMSNPFLGAAYHRDAWELGLKWGLSSAVTDATGFRGESATGSWWELEGNYCARRHSFGPLDWEPCGIVRVNHLSQTAIGAPSVAVLKQGAGYSSWSFWIGAQIRNGFRFGREEEP